MKGYIKRLLREGLKTEDVVFLDITKYKYNGFFSRFNEAELLSIIEFLNGVIRRTNSGLGVGIGKDVLNRLFFNTPDEFRVRYSARPSVSLWRGDSVHPCDDSKYNEYDYTMQSYSNKSTASFFGDTIWSANIIDSYGGSFSTLKFNKDLSVRDYWYLRSSYFYILTKDSSNYSKLFSLEEFYPIYYALKGNGIIGRKYQNWLLRYLKKNDINFNMDERRYDNELEIGDDEGEVMFFNVKYKCDKNIR